MTTFRKNKTIQRIACLFVAISFLSNAVLPGYARAQDIFLPAPTQFVGLSNSYSFPVLKGLKFDPATPFNMQFIIDTADQKDVDKDEASRLIKYFFAGLAIPEKDTWVNMSSYEKDRIIPSGLSETDLGKDLLSLDYILKQVSVSLTYPESEIGKDFWSRTYAAVLNIAHTTNLPINTFNKIWIMPDKAEVYEHENFALVHEATLKTMLEEDYLALKNNISDIQKQKKNMKEELIEKINKASSDVMREFILPKINKDVNSGKNFATLRQIYYALVLGVWFKKKFKDSIYKYYINQGKVKGIDINDKDAKDKIYNLYIEGLKKGLYNYIKSDYDPGTRRNIKRQYFSGGFTLNGLASSAIVTKVPETTLYSPDNLRGPGRMVEIAGSPIGAGKSDLAGSPIKEEVRKEVRKEVYKILDRITEDTENDLQVIAGVERDLEKIPFDPTTFFSILYDLATIADIRHERGHIGEGPSVPGKKFISLKKVADKKERIQKILSEIDDLVDKEIMRLILHTVNLSLSDKWGYIRIKVSGMHPRLIESPYFYKAILDRKGKYWNETFTKWATREEVKKRLQEAAGAGASGSQRKLQEIQKEVRKIVKNYLEVISKPDFNCPSWMFSQIKNIATKLESAVNKTTDYFEIKEALKQADRDITEFLEKNEETIAELGLANSVSAKLHYLMGAVNRLSEIVSKATGAAGSPITLKEIIGYLNGLLKGEHVEITIGTPWEFIDDYSPTMGPWFVEHIVMSYRFIVSKKAPPIELLEYIRDYVQGNMYDEGIDVDRKRLEPLLKAMSDKIEELKKAEKTADTSAGSLIVSDQSGITRRDFLIKSGVVAVTIAVVGEGLYNLIKSGESKRVMKLEESLKPTLREMLERNLGYTIIAYPHFNSVIDLLWEEFAKTTRASPTFFKIYSKSIDYGERPIMVVRVLGGAIESRAELKWHEELLSAHKISLDDLHERAQRADARLSIDPSVERQRQESIKAVGEALEKYYGKGLQKYGPVDQLSNLIVDKIIQSPQLVVAILGEPGSDIFYIVSLTSKGVIVEEKREKPLMLDGFIILQGLREQLKSNVNGITKGKAAGSPALLEETAKVVERILQKGRAVKIMIEDDPREISRLKELYPPDGIVIFTTSDINSPVYLLQVPKDAPPNKLVRFVLKSLEDPSPDIKQKLEDELKKLEEPTPPTAAAQTESASPVKFWQKDKNQQIKLLDSALKLVSEKELYFEKTKEIPFSERWLASKLRHIKNVINLLKSEIEVGKSPSEPNSELYFYDWVEKLDKIKSYFLNDPGSYFRNNPKEYPNSSVRDILYAAMNYVQKAEKTGSMGKMKTSGSPIQFYSQQESKDWVDRNLLVSIPPRASEERNTLEKIAMSVIPNMPKEIDISRYLPFIWKIDQKITETKIEIVGFSWDIAYPAIRPSNPRFDAWLIGSKTIKTLEETTRSILAEIVAIDLLASASNESGLKIMRSWSGREEAVALFAKDKVKGGFTPEHIERFVSLLATWWEELYSGNKSQTLTNEERAFFKKYFSSAAGSRPSPQNQGSSEGVPSERKRAEGPKQTESASPLIKTVDQLTNFLETDKTFNYATQDKTNGTKHIYSTKVYTDRDRAHPELRGENRKLAINISSNDSSTEKQNIVSHVTQIFISKDVSSIEDVLNLLIQKNFHRQLMAELLNNLRLDKGQAQLALTSASPAAAASSPAKLTLKQFDTIISTAEENLNKKIKQVEGREFGDLRHSVYQDRLEALDLLRELKVYGPGVIKEGVYANSIDLLASCKEKGYGEKLQKISPESLIYVVAVSALKEAEKSAGSPLISGTGFGIKDEVSPVLNVSERIKQLESSILKLWSDYKMIRTRIYANDDKRLPDIGSRYSVTEIINNRSLSEVVDERRNYNDKLHKENEKNYAEIRRIVQQAWMKIDEIRALRRKLTKAVSLPVKFEDTVNFLYKITWVEYGQINQINILPAESLAKLPGAIDYKNAITYKGLISYDRETRIIPDGKEVVRHNFYYLKSHFGGPFSGSEIILSRELLDGIAYMLRSEAPQEILNLIKMGPIEKDQADNLIIPQQELKRIPDGAISLAKAIAGTDIVSYYDYKEEKMVELLVDEVTLTLSKLRSYIGPVIKVEYGSTAKKISVFEYYHFPSLGGAILGKQGKSWSKTFTLPTSQKDIEQALLEVAGAAGSPLPKEEIESLSVDLKSLTSTYPSGIWIYKGEAPDKTIMIRADGGKYGYVKPNEYNAALLRKFVASAEVSIQWPLYIGDETLEQIQETLLTLRGEETLAGSPATAASSPTAAISVKLALEKFNTTMAAAEKNLNAKIKEAEGRQPGDLRHSVYQDRLEALDLLRELKVYGPGVIKEGVYANSIDLLASCKEKGYGEKLQKISPESLIYVVAVSALKEAEKSATASSAITQEEKENYLKIAKNEVENYLNKQFTDKKISEEIFNKAMAVTYKNLEFWATDESIRRLSPETQDAIFEAIQQNRWKDIVEVFRQDITFGTAGIRGRAALTLDELLLLKNDGPLAKILKGPNTINDIVLLRYTTGVIRYAKEKGLHKVVIGYDSRIAGEQFAEMITQCFIAQSTPEYKFTVYLFDEASPFPELSFGLTTKAVRADLGILISASHNPSEYNGYKVTDSTGSQLPQRMKDEVKAAISKVATADIKLKALEEAGKGQLIWLGGKEPIRGKDYKGVDVSKPGNFIDMHTLHVEQVKKFILDKDVVGKQAKNLSIGFSAFNGSGNKAVPRLLNELGFTNVKVIEKLQELDGLFPAFGWGEQPDPGDPISADIAVKEFIAEHGQAAFDKLDILIGTDPDADRMGLIVKVPESQQQIFGKYRLLSANDVWTLLIWYRLMKKQELGLLSDPKKHYITFSHVTTDALEQAAALFGVPSLGEMYDKTGAEERGYYLNGRRTWVGFTYIADFGQKMRVKGFINEGGAEESNGFSILGGPIKEGEVIADDAHVNDKDGTFAGILLAEIASYAKEKNTTTFELLDDIYLRIGHYATANKPLPRVGSFEGTEGITEKINLLKKAQEWMEQANERAKSENPFVLGGLKVIGAVEFKSGRYDEQHYKGFPDEGVRFFFKDSILKDSEPFYSSKNYITIRPSGTSQTIRFYTQIYSTVSKEKIAEQKFANYLLAEKLALQAQKELLVAAGITKYIPKVDEQLGKLIKVTAVSSSGNNETSEATSASSAINTPGGIDLGNIDVAASPNSIPVNMPPIDPATFQGFTFRIIKIEPIINLSSVFGPSEKLADDAKPREQLAYLKE